ncbi:hypothetical protein V6M85_13840 [Sulfolobus tengchongensis]|uniref:Uncharacterized protein n=1 Tax=Sulfolobus tengchongensis TaxID=207809 RepID=A0AAX4L2U7_9CREN
MLSPLLAIKILLLVPTIIFFFFSVIYYILYSIKAPGFESIAIRIISFILLGGAAILLSLYLAI